MRVTFFCFAKRKSPKKRRPPVCDPCAGATGQTCVGAVARCAVELTALRCSFVQTSTASQFTKHGRFDAHATPQPPRRRRSQQGVDSRTFKQPNSRTSIRAIASLGPVCAARGACAREVRPSEAMARVDVLLPVPLWMRRGAQGLADQGSRLSERSETERVRARPRQTRAPQVAP